MQGTLGLLASEERGKTECCKAEPVLVIGVRDERSALPEMIDIIFQKFLENDFAKRIKQKNQVIPLRQGKNCRVGIEETDISGTEVHFVDVRHVD
jgi:hypothetical protein